MGALLNVWFPAERPRQLLARPGRKPAVRFRASGVLKLTFAAGGARHSRDYAAPELAGLAKVVKDQAAQGIARDLAIKLLADLVSQMVDLVHALAKRSEVQAAARSATIAGRMHDRLAWQIVGQGTSLRVPAR